MSDFPSGIQVEEGCFQDCGLSLRYVDWQQPGHVKDTPVTIALHGWMDNAGTFENLIPKLEQTRVVALDFSGHGRSQHRSADAEYYIWDYVREVLALMNHLGLERCHLLAHSMGAAVATIFSAVFPEKVLSLVSLDMAGPIPASEDTLADRMRESFLARQEIIAQGVRRYSSFEAACESRARRGVSYEAAVALGRRGIAQDEEGWFWSVDRQLTRKLPVSLSEAQCRAVMKSVDCPTLVITAESVWSHRPDFLAGRLDCIGQLTHVSLQGSHFQHLEGDTESVARETRRFYRGLDNRPES